MAAGLEHRVLVASDGSPAGEAAVSMAREFPWPPSVRLHSVHIGEARAGESVIADARRFGATTIVVGCRDHGAFLRLLAGSVPREIAAEGDCSVLIVRDRPDAVTRFVLAYDDTPNANRAVDFLCSLAVPNGGRVRVVSVVELVPLPASAGVIPGAARAHIRSDVEALNADREQQAHESVNAAAARLRAHGWDAAGAVHRGVPLEQLLQAVEAEGAHVFVLGARATRGVERALLGSVANGALDRSQVPVLLVR